MKPMGKKRWAIAEGHIPGWSNGPEPEMASHDAILFLNTTDQDAHVEIFVFYADREPAGPYQLTVSARRTRHLRVNELKDPEPVPAATNYATLIESDTPVVVQYTRLDSRQSENALISTMAWSK